MRTPTTKVRPAPCGSAVTRPNFPPWLVVAFLVLATVLAYQPVWHAGFIWDDDDYVTKNLTLRNLAGLAQIWCNPTATPQYYPLVHTSFWLEYRCWSLNAPCYHIVNVLLHALAAILLWRVLVRLQLSGSWIAAGIFALHPVAVESVAWITERKNLLAAVFYFLAGLAWLRWTRGGGDDRNQSRGSVYWYCLSFFLFLAALLSKTTAASLPAAMLLVLWWKHGRVNGRDVWPLLPFFVTGVAMSWITSWLERTHVGAQGPEWAFSFPERCLIAGRAVWFYAGKLFWPANLTFIYPRWHINPGLWWQWFFPAAALTLLVVLWRLRQRIGRGPLVAALYFGGTLLPALGFVNFFPMRYSFVADHFQYLACVGPLALAAAGIRMAIRFVKKQSSAIDWLFCGMILLVLGGLTWRQCRMYANDELLWRTTLERNPSCWLAQNNLANDLLEKGRVDEAISYVKMAVENGPDFPENYNSLGDALLRKGQVDQAIINFQKALAIKPDYPEACNNLGTALLRKGESDKAITQYEQALAMRPNDATIHFNLANALLQNEQPDAAIVQYQRVLAIQPDFADAYYNLGNVLLQQGRTDAAINQFQKAISIKPDYSDARCNLGAAFFKMGKLTEAAAEFQAVIKMQPQNADAHDNLGIILGGQGLISEAISQFREATRIKPDQAGFHFNLGVALFKNGQMDGAISQFQETIRLKPEDANARNYLAKALEMKEKSNGQTEKFIPP